MMKRSGCKSAIGLFVLIAVLLISNSAFAETLDKKFSKEYNTKGNELLKIDNRYGDVTVESWNENRIVINVTVEVEHSNSDKAEKLLSMIEVEFSESDNTIVARTVIDSKFSTTSWNGNNSFSIDYEVKMPVGLDFDVVNRYGNVKIDELSGHVNIVVKYGGFYAEKLSRGNEKPLNTVSIAYGKGEIVETGWTELNLRYVSGKMTIGKAQALLVNSRYSKLDVSDVSSVVLDSRYDGIEIENLNNIVAETGYSSLRLGSVEKKLDVDAGYGSFSLSELAANFESVKVVANYCAVNIGVEENASYKIKLSAQYGNLSFDEDRAEILNRYYENTSKSVEAVVGAKSAQGTIAVSTKYGSVKVY